MHSGVEPPKPKAAFGEIDAMLVLAHDEKKRTERVALNQEAILAAYTGAVIETGVECPALPRERRCLKRRAR